MQKNLRTGEPEQNRMEIVEGTSFFYLIMFTNWF